MNMGRKWIRNLTFLLALPLVSGLYGGVKNSLTHAQITKLNKISHQKYQEIENANAVLLCREIDGKKILQLRHPDMSIVDKVDYYADGQRLEGNVFTGDAEFSAKMKFSDGNEREVFGKIEGKEFKSLEKRLDADDLKDIPSRPGDGVTSNWVMQIVGANSSRPDILEGADNLSQRLVLSGFVDKDKLTVLKMGDATYDNFVVKAIELKRDRMDADDRIKFIFTGDGASYYSPEMKGKFCIEREKIGFYWYDPTVTPAGQEKKENLDDDGNESSNLFRFIYTGGVYGQNAGLGDKKYLYWKYANGKMLAVGTQYTAIVKNVELTDGRVINDTVRAKQKPIKRISYYVSSDKNQNMFVDDDEKNDFYMNVAYADRDTSNWCTTKAFSFEDSVGMYAPLVFNAKSHHLYASLDGDGTYHEAADVDVAEGAGFGSFDVDGYDLNNDGLGEYLDFNHDKRLDGQLSFQGRFYWPDKSTSTDLDIAKVVNYFNGTTDSHTCFGGEIHDNIWNPNMATYTSAPAWTSSLGADYEEKLVQGLGKKGNGKLAMDIDNDGRISLNEFGWFMYEHDMASSSMTDSLGNWVTPKSHEYMCINTGDDREATFVREYASYGYVRPDFIRGDSLFVYKESDGHGVVSDVKSDVVPKIENKIMGTYPNPFNLENTVKFSTEDGKVKVNVFNARGQLVAKLFDGNVSAGGENMLKWNGTDSNGKPVSSGTYIYQIEFPDGYKKTEKVELVK